MPGAPTSLRLSLGATHNYDRTGPVLDGTVRADGIDLAATCLKPGELFRRMAEHAEFDVAEMSMSTYMGLVSRGDERFTGIPVFPSRMFRHGFIVINTSSGIRRPEDLRGCRIGMSEYQMTAAFWIRAILKDDYGVRVEDVEWVEGSLDEYEPPRLAMPLPQSIRIRRIPNDQTLSDMLEHGELDAVIDARLPGCFRRGVPNIQRLFLDYRAVETEYFRRTGFFPIMHTLVVRRSIYEEHRWVALKIFRAFEEAKEVGRQRLFDTSTLACALPWLPTDLDAVRVLFGGDAFPYGITKNRPMLEYMVRQSYEQGLSSGPLDLSALFAEEFSVP